MPQKPPPLLQSNRQKYTFSATTKVLLYIILLTPTIEATNLKMITPMITDLDIDSFAIDQDLIPAEFLSAARFSLMLEVLVTFEVSSDLDQRVDLFEWGNQSASHSVTMASIPPVLSFKIDDGPTDFFFPTLTSKVHESRRQFTLNLIFEFDADFVSAYILTFSSADSSTFPTATKTLLSTQSLSALNGHFLTLDLTPKTEYVYFVRNMYLVDRFFAESGYEVQNMFKGLANLHQAVYLYMEPTYSKVLMNRSRYSYSGGYSGEKGSSLSDLTSAYSTKEGKINWMLSTFSHEFMRMPLDALQSAEPASVSLVVNFDLYLRTGDSNFIDSGAFEDFDLINVLDWSDQQILKVSLQVVSYDSSASLLTYLLTIFDGDNQFLDEIIFEDEAVQVGVPLSLNMLSFSFFYKSENQTCVLIEVNKKTEDINSTKRIFCFAFPMESFSNLLIGTQWESWSVHPPFIVVLFDVQVFQGGYFITNGSDSSVLHSFSKTETEVVYCKNNRNLSRYSPNAEINKKHMSIKANASSCEDLVFDLNCDFSGCQICGLSTCLVCHENYELLDNGSCDSFDTNLNAFDNFSRKFLSEVSSFNLLSSVAFGGTKKVAFATDKPVYLKVAYDTSAQSDPRNIRFQFNSNTKFFAPSPYSMDAKVKDKFFGTGSILYKYIYISQTQASGNEVEITLFDMKASVYEVSDFCSPSLPPMKGSYLSVLCD